MTLSHTSLVTVDTYLYWAVQRLIPSLGTHGEGILKGEKLAKGLGICRTIRGIQGTFYLVSSVGRELIHFSIMWYPRLHGLQHSDGRREESVLYWAEMLKVGAIHNGAESAPALGCLEVDRRRLRAMTSLQDSGLASWCH